MQTGRSACRAVAAREMGGDIIALDGMISRTGAKLRVIGRESDVKAEHVHFCPRLSVRGGALR